MSDEYERDDEDEYGRPRPPPMKPPSMPPPSGVPPSMAPPGGTPPSTPPPTTSYTPSNQGYYSGSSQGDYDTTIQQLQSKLNQVNAQYANLNSQLVDKDNQIKQLTAQLGNFQSTMEGYQAQINQLNNEKAQLESAIPQLQNQLQMVQQENMNLQQQIGPLQSQVNKLHEELAYKEKRIQELKEPKAVMPSSLAQGITSQTTTPSYGTGLGTSPTTSSTPTPDIGSGLGSGRRVCPNCGASGFAIKEVEDKTKIISYIPKPQYAKKNVCTKCGFEF
jgi:archaellum component FlaC